MEPLREAASCPATRPPAARPGTPHAPGRSRSRAARPAEQPPRATARRRTGSPELRSAARLRPRRRRRAAPLPGRGRPGCATPAPHRRARGRASPSPEPRRRSATGRRYRAAPPRGPPAAPAPPPTAAPHRTTTPRPTRPGRPSPRSRYVPVRLVAVEHTAEAPDVDRCLPSRSRDEPRVARGHGADAVDGGEHSPTTGVILTVLRRADKEARRGLLQQRATRGLQRARLRVQPGEEVVG